MTDGQCEPGSLEVLWDAEFSRSVVRLGDIVAWREAVYPAVGSHVRVRWYGDIHPGKVTNVQCELGCLEVFWDAEDSRSLVRFMDIVSWGEDM